MFGGSLCTSLLKVMMTAQCRALSRCHTKVRCVMLMQQSQFAFCTLVCIKKVYKNGQENKKKAS